MKGILFDMDGVLYCSETPVKGAADTIGWVQERGIPHLFLTNTSSRGRDALIRKLDRFGIRTGREKILTPCSAAAEWLRLQPLAKTALFIPPEAVEEFDGIACVPEKAEAGASHVVVGDLGELWDYSALNSAFRLLQNNPEAVLIALGMTRFWHAEDGLRLDVAPFIAALECATGRKARIFGKPSREFYDAAAARLGLPSHEIWMIGDGIDTDIEAAQKAGLKGALVRTGKFRPSDLHGPVIPDLLLDSIAALPAAWDEMQQFR